MPTPDQNQSKPLSQREGYQTHEKQSQGTGSDSNNIFITEKPVEAEEHELAEDTKQEEPLPPEGEGQLVPFPEQEEVANFWDIDELNKNKEQVMQLLEELGFDNKDGQLTFEEFKVLMEALEKRINIAKEQEGEGESEREGVSENQLQVVESSDHESPRSATDEERAQYGSLLPRTGVHFLPDPKVIDFLKLLDEYRKK